MKNLFRLSLLSLSISSLSTYACDIHGHSGFMPENNLKIPVQMGLINKAVATGGINEAQFNKVMDRVSKLFTPFVAKSGRKFVIDRRWTDPTVNAYAEQNTPGVDTIHMFGGLARHKETTEDAMALVACHELGHHVGGAPHKIDPTGKVVWAANEGQADYWGTMKCFRKYAEVDSNVSVMAKIRVPQDVITKCESIYPNAEEAAICKRSSMAGLALGRLLNAITNGRIQVSFTTPDKSVVVKTDDNHPKAQCRLDTYYQAALCDHGFGEVVSQTDANVAVCSIRNGDNVGMRPKCWYKE